MIQRIAVVLDRHAEAERIAPYLSSITQPGVKIDFLIRAKARQAVWLMARTTALSIHNSSTVAVFEQQWGLELNEEKRIAELQLTPLSDSLHDAGATVAVRLYSGSLKKTLAQLQASYPEALVVLRPQNGWLIGRAVRTVLRKTGLRPPAYTPKVSLAFQAQP